MVGFNDGPSCKDFNAVGLYPPQQGGIQGRVSMSSKERLELRQWCIKQAIDSGAGGDGGALLARSGEIEAYVTGAEAKS